MTNESPKHADLSQDDIARWRKTTRAELIAARLALPASEHKRLADEIAGVLDELITTDSAPVVSLYWPFRGEPDLLDWMHKAHQRGISIALPVAVAKSQPMVFRAWTPDAPMTRDIWDIPIPADSTTVTPTVVVSPVVGFDPACFRLGYGGGFFDRTLAALPTRPRVIGVGHPNAEVPTIYPQDHDIPMDVIITGKDSVIDRS